MSATLLHGDCLEVMKTLPDKSVDLFLCDLPYGCLSGRAIGKSAEEKKCWSGDAMGCGWDIKIDLEQFWVQVERLMKNEHTPIIHFCNTRYGYELIKSKESWFRYDLVWEKTNAVGFLCANRMPMRSHENIYVFSKKGATYYRKDIEGDFPPTNWNKVKKLIPTNTYNGGVPYPNNTTHNTTHRCVKSVITIANKKGKGKHPTQKPDELYAWLIERYSKEGDTILDPTAGSFASVFTAEKLKRKAIGIEKDEAFYSKAKANGETE
jgi:site-specific DNA-methyltransferase (adenine-specific)